MPCVDATQAALGQVVMRVHLHIGTVEVDIDRIHQPLPGPRIDDRLID